MSAFLSRQMSWKIGNYRNGRTPKAGEMQKEMNEDVAHTSPLHQGDIYVACVIYSNGAEGNDAQTCDKSSSHWQYINVTIMPQPHKGSLSLISSVPNPVKVKSSNENISKWEEE
jgi:hypothetical protein